MPDREIRFHPLALSEAETARAWYAERNPHVADLFVAEIERAVERISQFPEGSPRIRGAARRFVFPKFPFSFIFRVESKFIEIIAVAHHRRRPGFWSSR